jgi:iron(III) transport system ATP-binding protein
MELADRIAVMSRGRVAQLGAPRELYENPQDIDVARFLGQSNELSIVVDRVEGDGGRIVGSSPAGEVTATWLPRHDARPPEPGERFVVFGRPGDFGLAAAPGVEAGGENRWHGRVEAARFIGSHTEYVVTVGELRLRCWVPPDAPGLADGAEVTVTARPDRLQAIREP